MDTWKAMAACRGLDPELFHPAPGSRSDSDWAKRLCSTCPVQSECVVLGLYENLGIWGGLTRLERHSLARLLGATKRSGAQPKPPAAHATNSSYRSGCRCAVCRDAHADYCREYNRQLKARKGAA